MIIVHPYSLVVHHTDYSLGRPMTYTYRKDIKAPWASVPRIKDVVALTPDLGAGVDVVEFEPTRVLLHFHTSDADTSATELEAGGFSRPTD